MQPGAMQPRRDRSETPPPASVSDRALLTHLPRSPAGLRLGSAYFGEFLPSLRAGA